MKEQGEVMQERRQGYDKLNEAVTNIAVLMERFIAIEDKVKVGFKSTEELIWSIKSDFKVMYVELKTSLAEHEAEDAKTRDQVQSIITFKKYFPYIALAFLAGSIGFNKTLDLLIAWFSG